MIMRDETVHALDQLADAGETADHPLFGPQGPRPAATPTPYVRPADALDPDATVVVTRTALARLEAIERAAWRLDATWHDPDGIAPAYSALHAALTGRSS